MEKECIKCRKGIEEVYSVCRACAEEFLSDNIFGMTASPLISSPIVDRYRTDSNPLLTIGDRPDGELIYRSGERVLDELRSIPIEDMNEDDHIYILRRMNVILAELGVPRGIDFENYIFSKAETKVFSELFYKLEDLEKNFPERNGPASLYLRIANLFYYSYRCSDTGLFDPDFREEIKKDYMEKAEGYYQISYDSGDESIYPLRNRAFLLLEGEKPEEAKDYFQKAVFAGDKEIETELGIVETSVEMDELEEAKKDIVPLKDKAEDHPFYWFLKGDIARKEDRWGRAIQFYDKSLEKDERYLPAMLTKADLLLERGWYDDAEVLYNSILHIDEENISALEGKAEVLIQKEEYEGSIEWLNEALAMDPHEIDIWIKKARCLRELKNPTSAIECYENALKIDDESRPAIDGKREIQNKGV